MSWSASASSVRGVDAVAKLRENFKATYPTPATEVVEQFEAVARGHLTKSVGVDPVRYEHAPVVRPCDTREIALGGFAVEDSHVGSPNDPGCERSVRGLHCSPEHATTEWNVSDVLRQKNRSA